MVPIALNKRIFPSKATEQPTMDSPAYPLNEALYGTELEVDGNKVAVRKNEVIDEEISNKNVLNRLVKRLLNDVRRKRNGDVSDNGENDVLYETIISNVMASKMFSCFREIGRCYITNKNYGQNCPDVMSRVFNGAFSALGDRCVYSAFQYHSSAHGLLPFAELCFNYSEYLVPVTEFPSISKLSGGKKYAVVNVKRTSGIIQKGIVKTDERSMVAYKVVNEHSYIHPSYAPSGSNLEPVVSVYFNSNCADVNVDDGCDVPLTDATKSVPLKQLIENNPEIRIDWNDFYEAFEKSCEHLDL